jgi:hypothetical protein
VSLQTTGSKPLVANEGEVALNTYAKQLFN